MFIFSPLDLFHYRFCSTILSLVDDVLVDNEAYVMPFNLDICSFSLSEVLRPGLVPKNFHPKLSHRILRHMHGVLNIDEKKLIAQFGWKSRDECFKTN